MSQAYIDLPFATPQSAPLLQSFDREIGEDSRVAGWWVFNGSKVTQVAGSKISALTDRSTKGKNLAQATDGNRPTFTSAALNGRPGAVFTNNKWFDVAGILPTAGDFSFTCVFKASAGTSGRFLMRSEGTNRFELQISGDERCVARIWDGANTGTRLQAITATDRIAGLGYAVQGAYSFATKTMRLQFNNDAVIVATNLSVPALSSANLRLGADTDGDEGADATVCEFSIHTADLFAPLQSDLKAKIARYHLARYGTLV